VAVLDALVGGGIPVDAIAVHFHDPYGQALANRHGGRCSSSTSRENPSARTTNIGM
jgi:hypothetical protein